MDFPDKSTYKPYYEKTLKIIDDLKKHDTHSLWVHQFYEVAIKLGEKSGLNEPEIIDLKIQKANTYELQAKNTSNYRKLDLLKKALLEYKKLGKKDEVDRLTLEIGKIKDPMQFEVIESSSINITEHCNYTRSRIQGKSFRDAVFEFSLLFPPLPNKEMIREQFSQKKLHLCMWFPRTVYDIEGKVAAKFSSDEERLEYWMIDYIVKYYSLVYHTVIVPALDIIKDEHEFSQCDVCELLENNLFIPEGHSDTFAKGIYYFLIGEFIEASYLLIPKVELCLRHLLSKQGEPVSVIKDDETEEAEINIRNLLGKCVKRGIFSNDLAWILEIYLCSKPINLRNNIAHGKLSDKEARSVNTCVMLHHILFGFSQICERSFRRNVHKYVMSVYPGMRCFSSN